MLKMMHRLRFLSFNIHGRKLNGKRNLHLVNHLLERLDVDIAVLQEVETRPSFGGKPENLAVIAGEGRPYHLIGASLIEGEGWYGNVIVSRYPIIRGFVHNLETHPSLEPRNAVDALIETPYGRIRVIGTHLSLSLIERFSEARNLIRLIKAVEEERKHPLLLMGDINEWQWPSKLLRYLNTVMFPVPCKGTFPSFFPVLRLDRVWYDASDIKITAHRLSGKGARTLSDHLPILVEVMMERGLG